MMETKKAFCEKNLKLYWKNVESYYEKLAQEKNYYEELARIAFNTLIYRQDGPVDYECGYDSPWENGNKPAECERELWIQIIKNIEKKMRRIKSILLKESAGVLDKNKVAFYECSECGDSNIKRNYNFCPTCGVYVRWKH